MIYKPKYKVGDKIKYKNPKIYDENIYVIRFVSDKNDCYYEIETTYGVLMTPFIQCSMIDNITELTIAEQRKQKLNKILI